MTTMPYAESTPRRSTGEKPMTEGTASARPADAADSALLASAIAGSEAAFSALYRRHGQVVYRFAYLWSGSAAVAADVTQEAFIHLHQRGGDFDPARGALQSWLLGITRNFVRRHLSSRYAEAATGYDDALLPEAAVDEVGS